MAASPKFGLYRWFNYSGPGNFEQISNIQSVSVNAGRTWATDPYSPGTCTIVQRGATDQPIGALMMLLDKNNDIFTGNVVFMGTVKDTRTDYGIVSNLDYTTITLEGYLARWGRRQFVSRAIAQAGTLAQISTLATAIGFNTFTQTYGNGLSIASAQTYVGNGLDLINLIMTTEMGHIAEIGSYTPVSSTQITFNPMVHFYQRNADTTASFTFADDSTASGIRYSDIQFTSAAQNYYTEAVINPQGLATQTAGSGDYNITQDSLDYTTGQALSHAQYLVSQYNSTAKTIVSITANMSDQDTTTRQNNFTAMLRATNYASGSLTNVIFRGNTYPCIIEGVSISADPSETTLTLTFSAYDNNNYLILNNAVFGTLGTSSTYPGNKLGF